MTIEKNLSNEAYHADTTAISKSGLDAIDRSPAIYYALHRDPNRPVRVPTPAMFTGTLTHCAVLEPQEWDTRYVMVPADAPKKPTSVQLNAKKPSDDTIAAIKYWADFAESTKGKEIVTLEQHQQAFAMSESLRKLPEIRDLLAVGEAEVSARALDDDTGIQLRVRPDWLAPAGNGVIIVDVKTCQDASPDAFARSIANWRYHVQAALYTDVYQRAADVEVKAFIFAAVEKDYPYAAAAYMLTDDDIQQGRLAYKRNLRTYAECLRTDTWPGYSTGITLLNLPKWLTKENEE